jgi:MFS family permease
MLEDGILYNPYIMQRKCVRLSVQASLKDGAFWALMTGFVEPYIVPFALALGASTPAIGFLRSVPALLGSLAQIINERLVAWFGSCRRAVLADVLVQVLAVGAGALSAFLPAPYGLYFLIVTVTIYTLSGAMANPPWAALMGEYIPARKRGEFFGFRSQLVGVTFFAGSFAASGILSCYGKASMTGFAVIFALAAVFRLISSYYVGRMYEPRTSFHLPKSGQSDFLKILDFRNNRVSAMFASAFMLLAATFLTAPFFSVYILNELRCDYFRYTFLMTVGPLMTYLFMKRWGQLADIFGSVRILKTAFVLIPAVPILWAFSRNFIYYP